jgi:hypothetical protein
MGERLNSDRAIELDLLAIHNLTSQSLILSESRLDSKTFIFQNRVSSKIFISRLGIFVTNYTEVSINPDSKKLDYHRS